MITKDIHFNSEQGLNHSGKEGRKTTIEPGYHQIISTISHELRTPVAIIKSNIQLLREFNYEIDPLVLEESFSLCNDSVDEVVRFLDNIQWLNRSTKLGHHPTYLSFGVKRIIHHLYARLASMNLDFHRIVLQWDLKDHDIISDKQYLRQVLLNVLSNALKFSNGKVQLIISTSNGQLSIKVQDRGIGIPEDDMELIFQPFYRASNAKHMSGTGLGLAIVHSMVENLGGKIQVASSMGEGSTVKIMIPYETSSQNSSN